MTKHKKLLIIIPYFVPAYSYWWPIKVAYDHAIGLQKKGYEVSVVTTDAFDATSRIKKLEETIDGIKIYRFRNLSNKLAKFHNAYLPLKMRWWLKKNIKNYDIIHIHDILNLPAVWGSKFAKKYAVKYFLHPHGILAWPRIDAKKSIAKKLLLKICNNMMRYAVGIFALTQQEIKEVEKYTDNTHIYHLPNGVDLKEFEKIEKIDLRKRYNLNKDTIIFSFLWRIQYIKWLDIAFHMLSEYNKINTNWRYLIIWPDEGEKEKLISLAKELKIDKKIIRYGMSTGKEKYSLLKSSDVFLFTSRAEWFPMTILEALWCNLPVCISKWCNLPEVDDVVWKVVDIWSKDNIKILHKFFADKKTYIWNIWGFLWNYNIDILIDTMLKQYEK